MQCTWSYQWANRLVVGLPGFVRTLPWYKPQKFTAAKQTAGWESHLDGGDCRESRIHQKMPTSNLPRTISKQCIGTSYLEGSFATWWAHSSNCDYLSPTRDIIQHFEPENQSKKGWFEPRKHWGCLDVHMQTVFKPTMDLCDFMWLPGLYQHDEAPSVQTEETDLSLANKSVSCAGGFHDLIEGFFVYCIYIYICNMLRLYSMSFLFSISKQDIFIDTFWEW